MKKQKQIRSRINELKIKENEISKNIVNFTLGTFEYRIHKDDLTEVRKEISVLEWVLN